MAGSPRFTTRCLTRRAWLMLGLAGMCRGREVVPLKAPVAAAPGFVYRAEKGGRVLFLASGLHRMKAEAYPLPAAYERAYRQSAGLWFESDPREAHAGRGTTEAERRGLMSGRNRLEDFLTESTRAALRKYLAGRKISTEFVSRMRPWYLGMYLMNLEYARRGILTRHGVDSYFTQRADHDDKPVRGLEPPSRSVDALTTLSAAEQDRNLAETLASLPDMMTFYTALTTAWRQGSEKDALRLLRPPGYAANESWRSLVAARNAAWAAKLDALKALQPVMIIVGLDHLIGPEGMVAQFTARGYAVTAVKP